MFEVTLNENLPQMKMILAIHPVVQYLLRFFFFFWPHALDVARDQTRITTAAMPDPNPLCHTGPYFSDSFQRDIGEVRDAFHVYILAKPGSVSSGKACIESFCWGPF